MKINKKAKIGIIIASFFFVFFNVLNILRNKNEAAKERAKVSKVVIKDTADHYTPLQKKWYYHSGDNSQWANSAFNDSSWQTVSIKLDLDTIPANLFSGIGWFRNHFSLRSDYVNKVIGIQMIHNGASEVYLDGKLISSFGIVSENKEEEKALIPKIPVMFSISDTNIHVLAIRYSNTSAAAYYEAYHEEKAGIELEFIQNPDELFTKQVIEQVFLSVMVLLFGFFMTLSIVHFLLFLFYRKQKQNLYYSIFVFLFSIMIISPYALFNANDPSLLLKIQYYYIVPTIFLLPSIVACLYSLFKPPHAKLLFTIEICLAILCWLSNYNDLLNGIYGSILFAFILFTAIESVRTIIVAVIQKKSGASIIGTGVIVFFLFVVTLLILAFVENDFDLALDDNSSVFSILLVVLCIISIPLSMSIYLAREFALTNKHLKNKLDEVESLSEKSIAQEKEKQSILASQKDNLEIQVKERTHEITIQKHEIEEKNKEITDSINYAQKIQHTLMASDKLLDDNLKKVGTPKDYFILYKPKDIVSGDFFWAYKPEQENSFILTTSDCTGHGVPGAFMSLLCISYLNEVVKEQRITKPNHIFNLVRDKIVSNFKTSENSERKDGMDAVICKINYDTNTLEYAAANNPIVILEPTENNTYEFVELKADKMPVGVTHDGIYKPFTAGEYKLKPGSLIYTFTDGYADQFGGTKGKKFMYKQMRELFVNIAQLSLKEQHDKLNDAIETWKGSTEQVDDILIIGIKF